MDGSGRLSLGMEGRIFEKELFSKRIFLFEEGIVDTGTREKGKELMQTVYHADTLHIRRLAERRTDSTKKSNADTVKQRDEYFPLKYLRPKMPSSAKQIRTKAKRKKGRRESWVSKGSEFAMQLQPHSS